MITEEEIKDLKYLFEECKDIMEDGYATIKLSLVKKLFDYYITYDRKYAKQKKKYESVLDEIREKIESAKVTIESSGDYSDVGYNFLISADKIVEILDKAGKQ